MTTYTVAEAARVLGVSPSTVRRWGDALSEAGALSETANPGRGERAYTPRDVRIIAWALAERKAGQSRADVVAMAAAGLKDEELPPIEALEAVEATALAPTNLSPQAVAGVLGDLADAQARIADALDALSASQSVEKALGDILARLDALERRIAALERRWDSLPGVLKRRWKDW